MEKERDKFITVGSPQIRTENIKDLIKVFRSGLWVNGPFVKELAEEFRKYIGTKYAIPVSSGTAALHLSLDCLGIRSGDEVITSTFSFPATSHVIEQVGARPIFLDIEKDIFNIDTEKIEEVINKRTKAIIPVHIAGHPCNMNKINDIAKKYNLFIIEDAAHAVESFYFDKKVGNIGHLNCFSFDVTKNVAGGMGGMITTNNEKFEMILKLRSHFGLVQTSFSEPYDTIYPGYKYDMTEFCAAIALNQLKKVEENLKTREKYWEIYNNSFSELREISLPIVRKEIRHARHLYMILLNFEYLKCNRRIFMEALAAKNVGSRIRFSCLHLHKYYKEKYNYKIGDLPIAEDISERVICIPFSAALTRKDINYIVHNVIKTVKEFKK